MTLVRRAGRTSPDAVFVVDEDTLPQTLGVLRTRAEPLGIRLHVADLSGGWPTDLPESGAFGVLLSYPGASGAVRDHRALDRKSTRLNSSHANISYAVFCLKKKTIASSLARPHAHRS